MGIVACRARLMLEARKAGVDFSSTLTLGRQACNMTPAELKGLRREFGIGPEAAVDDPGYRRYADSFFRAYLGARKLSVMDFSGYQGAEVVHDLNVPVPASLEESFDAVVDGGTLEHVFNFPVAVANCMRMLKTGGSLFIFSMANNHCGHGFYQFSPELFFRIFQEENGFRTEKVILVRHPFPGAELSARQECFQVEDPAVLGRRTNLVSSSPLGIMVHAVKTARKPIFEKVPQQSDYVPKWEGEAAAGPARGAKAGGLKGIWAGLPLSLRRPIAGYRQLWKSSLTRDTQAYRKWP